MSATISSRLKRGQESRLSSQLFSNWVHLNWENSNKYVASEEKLIDTQESEYQFWKRTLFPTERRITKFKKSGPILSKIGTKSGPRRWKSEPKILLGTVRQVGFFSRVATGQAVGVKQLLKSWQHPFGLSHLKYLVATCKYSLKI